jgi:hypothetical protein
MRSPSARFTFLSWDEAKPAGMKKTQASGTRAGEPGFLQPYDQPSLRVIGYSGVARRSISLSELYGFYKTLLQPLRMKYRKGLPIIGTRSPFSCNLIKIIKYVCTISSSVEKNFAEIQPA